MSLVCQASVCKQTKQKFPQTNPEPHKEEQQQQQKKFEFGVIVGGLEQKQNQYPLFNHGRFYYFNQT